MLPCGPFAFDFFCAPQSKCPLKRTRSAETDAENEILEAVQRNDKLPLAVALSLGEPRCAPHLFELLAPDWLVSSWPAYVAKG